ncbi:hypothetical protein Clacol_005173 [Clathrus columnatus]|uniref:Uncharacterized protein n=1 Tax=Clathrus columnatus TaxID=1419009 RepID=A0AAV5ADZ8_9AGAM|nr:hypothetical protein Clacol_005173 [Clathrus columnatus]
MSIVRIPPGTYSIESIKYSGRVIDLQGSSPVAGTPIITFNNNSTANQILLPRLAMPSLPSVSPGAKLVGTPLQLIGLQARATGGASVYQIIAPTQPGTQDLALVAGPNNGDQIEFRVLIASDPAQQWRFNSLG